MGKDYTIEVFKAQYAIHVDPRTPYQLYHELQYNQFGSVQRLMSAMRDYQRMAYFGIKHQSAYNKR